MSLYHKTGSLLDVALCAAALLQEETPRARSELYRRALEKWESSLPAPPQPSRKELKGSARESPEETAGEEVTSEEQGERTEGVPAEPAVETPPRSPRQILSLLALQMQQENRFVLSRQELEKAVRDLLFPDPERERPRALVSWAMKALQSPREAGSGTPALVPRGPEGYAFAHPLWQAFLAAEEMGTHPPDILIQHLEDPLWEPVVDFYAEWGTMEPVIHAWFSRPDDLWRTRLCRAARWVAVAPAGAPWRNGAMALLGRALLAPDLPEPIRWELFQALVRTEDPGVPIFLRHAAASAGGNPGPCSPRDGYAAGTGRTLRPDPGAGRLFGAGADRCGPRAGRTGHAGGPGGTDSGSDRGRRPPSGGSGPQPGPDGRRGTQSPSGSDGAPRLSVRRAAASRPGEIPALWAREMLEKAIREDREWIVRSAAPAALAEREKQAKPTLVHAPPVVSEMAWLIAWAAERGEGVGLGEAAFGPLLRALVEGNAPVRLAAAQTLGLVGRPEHADALRKALSDPSPEVARTAFWALRELSLRYGLQTEKG